MQVSDVCRFMDSFAPLELKESWDNCGLLIGDPLQDVERLMTCLTLTPESVVAAIKKRVNMIVAHHPLPFKPQKAITTKTTEGILIRELIKADISVYCSHTPFDAAERGINQQLAEMLDLQSILPLEPPADSSLQGGMGRFGELEQVITLETLLNTIRDKLDLPFVQYVGDTDNLVKRIALCSGAGGEYIAQAKKFACDTFLTGEANFHAQLEARACGMNLVLMTHFACERFACVNLADTLQEEFPDIEVWACDETDPLQMFV